eukprot:scaffold47312_cov20-Prasinocladus_malaysianus.AAC.1
MQESGSLIWPVSTALCCPPASERVTSWYDVSDLMLLAGCAEIIWRAEAGQAGHVFQTAAPAPGCCVRADICAKLDDGRLSCPSVLRTVASRQAIISCWHIKCHKHLATSSSVPRGDGVVTTTLDFPYSSNDEQGQASRMVVV